MARNSAKILSIWPPRKKPYDLNKLEFFGDYLGVDCYGGRTAVLWMHPMDRSKKLGISAAVLDFEPGTQNARVEMKDR